MKSAIAKAFNRAAYHYDKYADFQREVGYELIQFAKPKIPLSVTSLLDAGCGTGYFSRYWREQGYHVTALDFADNMLEQARQKQSAHQYIQADLETLSSPNKQYDLSFSNLTIQWCDKFDLAIKQLYQTTQHTLMFTTIIDDSLQELNLCRLQLDGIKQGNTFLSQNIILHHCQPYPLNWQIKTHKLIFPSITALLASLKGVGATYQTYAHKKGLTPRHYFKQLEEVYYHRYGELSLTYHIFYGVIDCG